jgi:putative addiction module component (TIGR02574 family)
LSTDGAHRDSRPFRRARRKGSFVHLLDSLDELTDEGNDTLWAQEAERRYAEYKAGNIEAVAADEMFSRLAETMANLTKHPPRR